VTESIVRNLYLLGLSRNYLHFTKPESLLLCLQESATYSYPELHECSPHQSYFLKTHFKDGRGMWHYAKQERWFRFFLRILERKRPLGRPGLRWKNNIKISLKEVEWEVMHWTDPGFISCVPRSFSDNGFVSVASQAAVGKDFLLRPAFRFQLQQLRTRLPRTNRTTVFIIEFRVPSFDVRLRLCTAGQITRELAKIQVHRLPFYVTIQYKTYIHFI
jgi:hypothetical protein